MTLIFNEKLVSANNLLKAKDDEILALQEKIKSIRELNQVAFDEREQLKKQAQNVLEQKKSALQQQMATIYRNQTIHKFSAKLSEDENNVEVYTSRNMLVGAYTKEGAYFKPVSFEKTGISKSEDIVFGQTVAQVYAAMESVFRQ